MVSRRPRLRASVPALVLAWILALGAPGATGAASPTPSPGTPSRPGGGLTGHWASPVNMAGIDLVQDGSRLTGSAINGLHLDGSISGRNASFAFWYGASYASASADRRGHGSLTVSPDGNAATVSWQDENPKGKDNGSFQIMRVSSPVGGSDPGGDPGTEPGPEPGDEALPDVGAEVTGMTTGATAAVTEVLLAAIEQAIAAAEAALEDAEAALETGTSVVDPSALAEALRLRQVADGLKVTSDLADQVANTAQLASAEANQALQRAQNNDVGSRQDVLLTQSGVDQANARLVAAQLQATQANVAVAGAKTEALNAQGSAEQAGQVLAAATQARADAEARLAAAGDGAPAALRAEVNRAIAAEQAATTDRTSAEDRAQALADAYWTATARYQELALNVTDTSGQVELFKASLEKAKAQVPLAAAELVRARADAATKAQASAFLTAKAWQDYVNYDKAYWTARLAMEALAKPSAAPH